MYQIILFLRPCDVLRSTWPPPTPLPGGGGLGHFPLSCHHLVEVNLPFGVVSHDGGWYGRGLLIICATNSSGQLAKLMTFYFWGSFRKQAKYKISKEKNHQRKKFIQGTNFKMLWYVSGFFLLSGKSSVVVVWVQMSITYNSIYNVYYTYKIG